MDPSVIDARLRAHRLTAPAITPVEAAEHLLAVQAQEFWGGRWALGVRCGDGAGAGAGVGAGVGAPTLSDVDAAFERGELVRSWTMRGTIHVIAARDLGWVLSVTGERQRRQAASRQRQLGLDDADLVRAERVVASALDGGGRLTRDEMMAVLDRGGVSTAGQRGYHLLYALSVRGLICQGPVVPRDGAPTREQYFVLSGEWIREPVEPDDPLAEFFVRYIRGHGPAGAADFAWWSGLPLTVARRAAAASADRLVEVDDGVFRTAAVPPADPRMPRVVALPSFDEYYLSYTDRTTVATPELAALIGPGKNGLVRPILLADGLVAGTWAHSKAVGRHTDDPVPDLVDTDAASPDEVVAALDRYARFIAG
ncbi:winged helix DNA-binding domain-containing protein [Microbacterium sp.]|uniref:winged helix DNA-binding domain-containing protein n=1 Tax=Microbacterium sp. TaxID=51671 RepID=UPI003A94D72E